jgi:hypothetical protein
VTSTFDVASDVLEALVALYAAQRAALPTRRFVYPGPFSSVPLPPGCEQAIVSVESWSRGDPGTPRESPAFCFSPYTATLTVAVIRCVPTVDTDGVPIPTEWEAAAATILADGDLLWRHGDQLPTLSNCSLEIATPVSTLVPRGSLGGVTLRLLVDLGAA